ncbi:hypothetical protein M422DRAFT_249824 [Sphaerobolus stellatus SS14]|uniref:Uncharacterized protein n=1 Tax=Sphaerobolus stellatus (strain SS14) TaxID=990650 RepID=A0A0C9W3P0_SPHS4|nr:hypothetical protein M422DRAFT_249824 [Sphaerobolus stellatus SS14]
MLRSHIAKMKWFNGISGLLIDIQYWHHCLMEVLILVFSYMIWQSDRLQLFYIPPKLYQSGDAIYDRTPKLIIIHCAENTEISVARVQQEMKKGRAVDFWNGILPEKLNSGILKLSSTPSPQDE